MLLPACGQHALSSPCNASHHAQEGDYHDTIMLPSTGTADEANPAYVGLRIQPGQFAGYSVMHCHLLRCAGAGRMPAGVLESAMLLP